MNFKSILGFTFASLLFANTAAAKCDTIPLKGNGYITSPDAETTLLSYNKTKRPPLARGAENKCPAAYIDEGNGGISDWYNKDCIISTYFRVEKSGQMNLKMIAKG